MVIDFHTHVFPDKIAGRTLAALAAATGNLYQPCTEGTKASLVEKMDRFGVDLSVVQPVVTKPSQSESINRWAAEITSGRLISFGGLYPTDSYKEDIDRICALGLKGIKLHPEYQQFYVDDPRWLPLYDYALSKGLMLLFHAGYDPGFPTAMHSTPAMYVKILKELQGGVIIAAHLGGEQQWDQVEELLCGTEIYLDTSMGFDYYSREQFLRIVRSHGADRILFGSDSPWSRADRELAALRALPLAPEEKEQILWKNAAKLLGLS